MHGGLLAALSSGGAFVDVGRSVREAFYMFWETLWALVAGFGLAGAVQAFSSRQQMRARLGNHGPGAILRASSYGIVSSSCSYAASAMARSLFVQGADFVSAMVFMVASTNLVLELGIVLLVLIGWQFLAAEFVGGTIMIIALALAGSLWLRGRSLEEARAVAEVHNEQTAWSTGSHGDETSPTGALLRMSSLKGWSDAASYTMSDLKMLRREMAIGFVVAGFLTVLLPVGVWRDVFLQGHGIWTTLENAAVGPLVAMASFVCSVGNVPLAAALWKGGVSFGGVVSFIFADLITLPLLFIYKKQYGVATARRMLAVFWPVMSLAGLLTEAIFRAGGIAPTRRPAVVATDTFRLGPTTILDVIALVAFAVMYLLYKNRARLGSDRYETDPVCGMQVERRHAPASLVRGAKTYYFCSEHCRERFSSKLTESSDSS